MSAAFALAIMRGNNIFICISETTAVVSEILFHGKGRDGKRHFYAFPGFGLLCENVFGVVCISRWKSFALTSVEAATNTKNKNSISAKYAQSVAEGI